MGSSGSSFSAPTSAWSPAPRSVGATACGHLRGWRECGWNLALKAYRTESWALRASTAARALLPRGPGPRAAHPRAARRPPQLSAAAALTPGLPTPARRGAAPTPAAVAVAHASRAPERQVREPGAEAC